MERRGFSYQEYDKTLLILKNYLDEQSEFIDDNLKDSTDELIEEQLGKKHFINYYASRDLCEQCLRDYNKLHLNWDTINKFQLKHRRRIQQGRHEKLHNSSYTGVICPNPPCPVILPSMAHSQEKIAVASHISECPRISYLYKNYKDILGDRFNEKYSVCFNVVDSHLSRIIVARSSEHPVTDFLESLEMKTLDKPSLPVDPDTTTRCPRGLKYDQMLYFYSLKDKHQIRTDISRLLLQTSVDNDFDFFSSCFYFLENQLKPSIYFYCFLDAVEEKNLLLQELETVSDNGEQTRVKKRLTSVCIQLRYFVTFILEYGLVKRASGLKDFNSPKRDSLYEDFRSVAAEAYETVSDLLAE